MAAKYVIVAAFVFVATFAQVDALVCTTCMEGQNCIKESYNAVCPPDQYFCYAVARSLEDKTPIRLGCSRSCEEVIGGTDVDSRRCSVCGTDNCNRGILGDGHEGSSGFSAATHTTAPLISLLFSFLIVIFAIGLHN